MAVSEVLWNFSSENSAHVLLFFLGHANLSSRRNLSHNGSLRQHTFHIFFIRFIVIFQGVLPVLNSAFSSASDAIAHR